MNKLPPVPAPCPVDLVFPEQRKLKEERRCPMYRQPITSFRNRLSEKEYGISGLCQSCQDKVFGHD